MTLHQGGFVPYSTPGGIWRHLWWFQSRGCFWHLAGKGTEEAAHRLTRHTDSCGPKCPQCQGRETLIHTDKEKRNFSAVAHQKQPFLFLTAQNLGWAGYTLGQCLHWPIKTHLLWNHQGILPSRSSRCETNNILLVEREAGEGMHTGRLRFFLTTLLALVFTEWLFLGCFVNQTLSPVISSFFCLVWFLNSRQTRPGIIVLDRHSSCLGYFLPV